MDFEWIFHRRQIRILAADDECLYFRNGNQDHRENRHKVGVGALVENETARVNAVGREGSPRRKKPDVGKSRDRDNDGAA